MKFMGSAIDFGDGIVRAVGGQSSEQSEARRCSFTKDAAYSLEERSAPRVLECC